MATEILSPSEKTRAREDILNIIQPKKPALDKPPVIKKQASTQLRTINNRPSLSMDQAVLTAPAKQLNLPKIKLSIPKTKKKSISAIKKISPHLVAKKKIVKKAMVKQIPVAKIKRRAHPDEKNALKRFAFYVLFFFTLMILGVGVVVFIAYQYHL